MTNEETLKMALEALKTLVDRFDFEQFTSVCELDDAKDAIKALEEALAKQEQPTVRTGKCLRVGVCASEGHKIQAKQEQGVPEVGFGNIKQEQCEPVAWMYVNEDGECEDIGYGETYLSHLEGCTPLYTTPRGCNDKE